MSINPGEAQIGSEDGDSFSVVRSFDPNDKLGPSGYGSAGYLQAGGVMAYQIRFENQPSATAPAQRVTITDTLDPNLDLSTFELTEITFANQSISIPSGLKTYQTRLSLMATWTTHDALTLPPNGEVACEGERIDANMARFYRLAVP